MMGWLGRLVGGAVEPRVDLNRYFVASEPSHVLAIGPCRTGKTSRVAIPALLAWDGPCVVHDLSGECFEAVADRRRDTLGQRVIRFAPAEAGSACWNVLDEIRVGTVHERDDAVWLAGLLVDSYVEPYGERGSEFGGGFFLRATVHLLSAVLLLKKGADLPAVAKFVGQCDGDTLLAELSGSEEIPVVLMADMLRGFSKTGRDWLVECLNKVLSPFADDGLAGVLSRSDFKLSELAGTSVFFVNDAPDDRRFAQLKRLFFGCAARFGAMSDGTPLLVALDSAESLGWLPRGEDTLDVPGIKFLVCCQWMPQVERLGVKANAFRVKVFFGQANQEAAADCAVLAGRKWAPEFFLRLPPGEAVVMDGRDGNAGRVKAWFETAGAEK